MRILFISAFYPPYVIGGWEQLVQDINTHLQARGHITQVLTSDYGVTPASPEELGVARLLHLDSALDHYRPLDFFTTRRRNLEENLASLRVAVERFLPDVIFVHVMWNLSRGIPWLAEQLLPGRVIYYIANDWPYRPDAHRVFWEDPARGGGRRFFKRLVAPYALRMITREERLFRLSFEHVLAVSQAVKRDLAQYARLSTERMQVIYNGVETEQFLPVHPATRPVGLSLLYAGSLAPHKGVHTAIQAMARVAAQPELEGVTLSLVGSGHPEYEDRLKRMVVESGLEGRVRFLGRVPRREMPRLFQRYDVLVFPSVWQEPLARVMQEAMASGLVVIGTLTGGTPEILQEDETGLTFAPEDAEGLARGIERLSREPGLRERLSKNARQVVLEKFDLNRMIDEIEAYLQKVADRQPAAPENLETGALQGSAV